MSSISSLHETILMLQEQLRESFESITILTEKLNKAEAIIHHGIKPNGVKRTFNSGEYEYLRNAHTLLNDDHASAIIKIFNEDHCMNVLSTYFFSWVQGNSWISSRKYFDPEKDGAWITMKNSIPINTNHPLIIPINCKLGNTITNNH